MPQIQTRVSPKPFPLRALLALVAFVACGGGAAQQGASPPDDDGPLLDAAVSPRGDGAAAALDAASAPPADARVAADLPRAGDAAAGPADGAPPAPDAASGDARTADGAAVAPEQTTVPVLWIEVDKAPITADTKTKGRLKVIEAPGDDHNDLATRPSALTTPIGIAVRGNYTRMLAKKPYSLELRDEAGDDKAQALLGMPAESDFVLNASYLDQTFLRNPLSYAIAQRMGHYASRFRFVEVYIDGAYQGLYLLQESVKRDKGRVDIPKPAPSAAEGDLTGGYIFRLEGPGKGATSDWKSAAGTTWTYGYPKAKDITAEQKAYLKQQVDRFESVMASATFADKAKGYPALLDVPSFVDYAILEEFVRNWDSYWKSAHFYRQSDARGGRIYAGPVWDFDNAFGMADFAKEATGRLQVNMPLVWKRIWTDPAFLTALKCRWQEVRSRGPITQELIDADIARWTTLIRRAEMRENARWHLVGAKISPIAFTGPTYDAYVDYLRSWIKARLQWLDAEYGKVAGACDAGG